MSYLNTPRLTFSGQFQADPSTVNNDPTHFNNKTFRPNYQDYSSATDLNGWWNPDGTGNWRFIGCKVTSATYLDGTSTNDPFLDPVIGMAIMDTDSRTAGKIVDLDPQQQMVSELWGLVVRIVSEDGINMMRGDYDVAPFTNIWFNRSVDQFADSAAGAVYQSVIKDIKWNSDYSKSRFLNELRQVSANQLSIQFNVDRYNGDNTSPQFTLGRIAGSIGPSTDAEPRQFVLGRQLFPINNNPPQPPPVNYATAIVDERLKQVVLDFGNALQFSTGGVVNETRDLRLAVNTGSASNPSFAELGKINYAGPEWYMGTSGICVFPLNAEQVVQAQQYPLAIVQAVTTPNDVFTTTSSTTYVAIFNESVQYVRADKFVFRLDPEDQCSINFYATSLGKPLANATIQIQHATAATLGADQTPPIGAPAISYFSKPVEITSNAQGLATLTFQAPDPGNPRSYIDGQVYGLSYNLSTQTFADCNPSNFISSLIFTGSSISSDIFPDWDNFIQPIMQQYANLYPLMSKGIFNLADKNVVDSNAQILKLVFGKHREDPNYMPATRDLSAHKRKVILEYLQAIIDKEKH